MRRTLDSGLFWNIKFGGGPKNLISEIWILSLPKGTWICAFKGLTLISEQLEIRTNQSLWMFLVIRSVNRAEGAPGAAQLSVPPTPQPSLPPGMTHLSLHRARPGLSLAQKTACIFCCCYLAIMPGSFLSMNSCIHWCSVELLRNLRKDSTYLLWSVNRLLMEDAIFGFLSDREGREV